MVTKRLEMKNAPCVLSVLALSSRFDGPYVDPPYPTNWQGFQYSLCRVVLMVEMDTASSCHQRCFQYSLCRVVLMVSLVLFF